MLTASFRFALGTALLIAATACVQTLPNAESMSRFYQAAEKLAQRDIAELDRRRAAGEINAEDYKAARADIEDNIADRANTMAWTKHNLEETLREAQGLPSPDHYTSIAVPEAGSLPTGSTFARFNNNEMGSSTNESMAGMRSMTGGSGPRPGSHVRGNTGSGVGQ